jgi:hypothetical protein
MMILKCVIGVGDIVMIVLIHCWICSRVGCSDSSSVAVESRCAKSGGTRYLRIVVERRWESFVAVFAGR